MAMIISEVIAAVSVVVVVVVTVEEVLLLVEPALIVDLGSAAPKVRDVIADSD